MATASIRMVLCIIVMATKHVKVSAENSTSPQTPFGEKVCSPVRILTHGNWTITKDPVVVRYFCSEGYNLQGPPKQQCLDGVWDPPGRPMCVLEQGKTFCISPSVENGIIHILAPSFEQQFAPGDEVIVQCKTGYSIHLDGEIYNLADKMRIMCAQDGKWVTTTQYGWPVKPVCKKVKCDPPPQIPYGQPTSVYEAVSVYEEVYYRCDEGYYMITQSQPLKCKDGQWNGVLPTCIPANRCSAPTDIENGFYESLGTSIYSVGVKIQYSCRSGYSLLGTSILECKDDRTWSHEAPKCERSTNQFSYCPPLSPMVHGYCLCVSGRELPYCEPFYTGLHVECSCEAGYKFSGESRITCGIDGTWDYPFPYCTKEDTTPAKDSANQDDGNIHMSTLAIVVATACSVLGVLLLVMVIMIFRRRKPHPRLCRPSTAPPPYSRVHSNSLDDHDRVLLIGYEQRQATLPSYEEATSGFQRPLGSNFGSRSGGGHPGEYRALPSIPPELRHSIQPQQQSGDNTNRHSIITTSTVNTVNNNWSEGFGSLDTVNVSVSDASTAVTIETFDSGLSHQSNSSDRVNAGSLGSSSNSLATEDAPLLESSEREEERIPIEQNEENIQDKLDD
ncbi:hypothetical protein ACJMK2_036143 [Sinanodonta woodiana]|uniref:Sushi domain-containing protein n=1 Tax=Sinanodonta woodiana TaxID=1069815 RepID=A0ABD3WJN7_SINWO